jgi:hypothetical protein
VAFLLRNPGTQPFDQPGIALINFASSLSNSRAQAMTFRAVRADKTEAGQVVKFVEMDSLNSWMAMSRSA